MTGKELLEIIIVKIENLGIELKYEKLSGASAYISYKYGWGIIDIERATAFEICHEYIHAKNKGEADQSSLSSGSLCPE